jgi:hypothetical protein
MFPARAITLLALGTMENTNLDHTTRAAKKRACHYENAVKRYSSECQNGNPILALVLEAKALATTFFTLRSLHARFVGLRPLSSSFERRRLPLRGAIT